MSERQGRYRVKRDANQSEIEQALTTAGYVWHDTSRLGGGFPDLVAKSKSGIIVLFEVKVDGGTLTDDEKKFFSRWCGNTYFVVFSAQDALDKLYFLDRYFGV